MKYKITKFINTVKVFFTDIKNIIKINPKVILSAVIFIIVFILGIMFTKNKDLEEKSTNANLNNSGFSIEKSGWIYYLGLKDNNTDGIYKIKSNSDKKQKVNSDYSLYLNKSGKFLYYLDSSEGKYNIVKVKTNGEDKEVVIENVDAAKFAVVDNWIYYFKDFNFYRAKTNGEEKQVLSKKSIKNYEISGNWIYYSYINDGKTILSKMKTDGENITKIDNNSSDVFFVKDSNIYYVFENFNEDKSEYNYELYRVKTNGKNKEKIADLGQKIQLESINFNEDKIYYTKTNENDVLSIYSIKINGKDENKIVEIHGYSTLINIHDNWVYYTDINENGDSQMFRIKTNGKNKQTL